MSRWRSTVASMLLIGAGVLGGLTFGPHGSGALAAEGSLDTYTPAPAEPGTDIPSADVKFGMRPYADNTFYIIAMKKGWFKDVGINILPDPYGLKVTDTNVVALLLNRQLDMSSEFCPLLLPTYKSAKTLKCVAFTDDFLGEAILANPNLHLKSFKDYIAEGKSFDEAIRAALAPLNGKTLVGAPELSDRPFEEAAAKFAGVQWNLQVLDDPKSLVLAKAGRIDFINPEGAPIVYTLEQAGWTKVLDIGDLYKHGPGGIDSPVEPLVANVGVAGNAEFVNANPNAVLRFLSVVWRTIDQVGKDPSLFELQAPYLNSVAGTSLDGKGVEATVKALDPLSPFDYNKTYFDDTSGVLYYKNAWAAIIKNYAEHGIVPEGAVTPDQIIWAAAIWHQMVDYRTKAGDLIKSLEGKSLDGSKQELLTKAKQHFGWYDFLDAYRLASAAAA
jgi:ABC-type nitrate/sulfonate/bicarbonate transport system substrate-binding protein